MNTLLKGFLAFLLFALPMWNAGAQTGFRAEAHSDSTRMLIGDQTILHISITGGTLPAVAFPHPCDTCLHGLEIIRRSAVDTQQSGNGVRLSQEWTLTGFDSGRFEIPSLTFYGKDSQPLAATAPVTIDIRTLPVDTASAIKDIKPLQQVPITLKEIGAFIGIGLVAMAVIAGIIILIRRLRKRKRPQTQAGKRKPDEPAHVTALRALEALRQKKLWQEGRHKQYYSELSDILRTYLDHRWDIPAMEMVSDEIMGAIRQHPVEPQLQNKLRLTLQTADSVKFAKACPLPDENSQAFQSVYEFVEATKAVEHPTEKEGGKKDE